MSILLKNKLFNYQEQPPEGAWENISDALNEEHASSIGERLYHHQATPNTLIWERISRQLHSNSEESISKKQPVSPHWGSRLKYISAAAILILVATGLFLVIDNRTNTDVADNSSNEIRNNHPTNSAPSMDLDVENNSEMETENFSPLSGSKDNKNTVTKKNSRPNRYIFFTTNRGKTIRVSRKLYALFNCADNATAMNSKKHCQEDIQSLQHKIATASVIPTSDFSSIIDMIKTLEEEQ